MRGWLWPLVQNQQAPSGGDDQGSDLPQLVAPVLGTEAIRVDDDRLLVPGEERDDDECRPYQELDRAQLPALEQVLHG